MYQAILAILLLIAAPGNLSAQAKPPTKASGRTIGVISAIGDKFALQKVGMTVFGNELTEMQIESWGIDDLVSAKVAALLSKRFTVKRVAYAKGAFASLEKPGGLFRDYNEELGRIVRQIGSAQKCDLYLVVTKGGSKFGTTNQFVQGLGLVVAGSAFFDNSHLFALATMKVYDGQTFKVLREERTSIGQATFMQTIVGPHREVDKSWWPTTPQSTQRLRETTRSLVEQSVAMTLPQLVSTD